MIRRNDGFICLNCGVENPPAPRTCRNHCRVCLYSQHVDAEIPGDRASICAGLMKPMAIEHDVKREWMIRHKCERCGKVQRNKVAEDDELKNFFPKT